jgi:M6 family metalloprotease-like protein
MKTILIIATILFLCLAFGWSAPLKNVKVQIKQPNGKIIDCLASGDEFYNWAHDKDNYTIIQDKKTGYYCYAVLENEELVASKFVVGIDDPSKTWIKPGNNIKPEKIQKIRTEIESIMRPDSETNTHIPESNLKSTTTVQTMNNIVVYIRFADQTEFEIGQPYFTSLFNSSTSNSISVINYFKEASFNSLDIVSSFYPTNNGTIITSYKDPHIQNYYREYSTSNDSGYYYSDLTERFSREWELVENAVNSIKNQIPSSLNVDYNNDGYIDNVCIIVRGDETIWASILWPHLSYYLSSDNIYINSKRLLNCIIVPEQFLTTGVSTACHEMFHSLGATDLYHYSGEGISPVSYWDIMAVNFEPPQSMGAYMKYRYGKWIESIPEITQSGHYTLNPVTSSTNNCYRISSPKTSEYFVLEFRRKFGTFEGNLPGTGLLIYRINSVRDGKGNSAGPAKPDEVYIYRIDGTITASGSIQDAFFDNSVGRTTFHNSSNPSCFLSDGSLGNIYIKNVMVSGNFVSFDVRFCDGSDVTYSNTNQLPQFTNAINKIETTNSVTVKSTDNVTFEAGQEIILNGFEVQQGGVFEINMNGCGE